jgi:hypothetical protein
MKNYKYLINLIFVLTLVTGMAWDFVSPVHAQSPDGWTDPVNLSNSGSSVNPSIVVDSQGMIHAFWLDEFNGYQYAKSADGVSWSEPKTVPVPFLTDPKDSLKPVLLAGPDGTIHILWQDKLGGLFYGRATSATLGTPSSWTGRVTLADSAVRFDAVVDPQGALQVGYINNVEQQDAPAGIYYRRQSGSSWLPPVAIYPSKYYRSLTPKDEANIQLATSSVGDTGNVYIVWDDRSQKRIFLIKSTDGGKTWGDTFEVRGPNDFSGLEMPYNINLGAAGDQVLLTWQAGTPGSQCIQYSQWSTDGAKTFGQPVKVLENFAQCPQSSQFLLSAKDLSVVLFNTLGDLSLEAWDGSRWSTQLTQRDIASFTNPATLDNVILGCQNAVTSKEKIYLVGCDTGQGGDIWFSSRPLGSVDTWFPPPSSWSDPAVLTDAKQAVNSLLSVADHNGRIHDFWVQNAPEGEQGTLIQYSRWDGKKWTTPATIISGPKLLPSQITASIDSSGKLLLAWVDASSGDMYFTWANSNNASSASEWQAPIYIPSISSANSSPDIVTDASGKMVVAFAVPINEQRGIYLVQSDDLGTTWTKPYRVFDAAAINWQMVDRPQIALTGDGRLHLLFERYTLLGDQRSSNGLYYIQSSDGGATWSQPETVSEQPILWSDLIGYGKSDLHRIWMEQRGADRASIHQYSSDGGTTWGAPNTLSTLNDGVVANHVSIDLSGNLYFLQLTGPEEPVVRDQRWEGTTWKLQPSKALEVKPGTWEAASIASSVSSDGHLVASLLGNSLDPKAAWQSEILYMVQSPKLAGPVPTAYPALIAPAPAQVATQTVSEIFGTPTAASPLAGLNDTQPFLSQNRNLIGLLLLGLVVAFLVLILLATSRTNRTKGKGKTKAG